MLKIGLTGGIGSGKTKVSKIFAEKGFKIFNSDEIAKTIIRNDHSVKNSIINFFGTNSYIGSGSVVTKNVGKGQLAIGRGRQKNMPNRKK